MLSKGVPRRHKAKTAYFWVVVAGGGPSSNRLTTLRAVDTHCSLSNEVKRVFNFVLKKCLKPEMACFRHASKDITQPCVLFGFPSLISAPS